MLKSTYKPSANLLASKPPPLAPGWTEHKAPTGHTYYYNAETKESTYKRPGVPNAPEPEPQAFGPAVPHAPQAIPNLSDPRVANAFLAAQTPQTRQQPAERVRDSRPKPQPVDKPRSKIAIPGCEPWVLVFTKCGRRFAYNPVKNASYWRIPDRLKPAILELDQARVREKANAVKEETKPADEAPGAAERPRALAEPDNDAAETSSEYEEIEVTDDEGENKDDHDAEADGGHRVKRQRAEEAEAVDEELLDPEAEMLFQLQMMNNEYDGQDDEVDEVAQVSEEDARELFKDMLNDFKISPYSPWEKLLEDGKVFDDARYTVLSSTKARKEVWEWWCRDKIKELKQLKDKEEKKDPKVIYLEFLEKNASPKLYWPEFKRKFRKEACMKDFALSDKEREKWYREHISRLKLSQATLKSDLTALLKSLPLSLLNRDTNPSQLPTQLRADIRYISLPIQTRDPLVEAYIQTLRPAPEGGATTQGEDEVAATKAKEARRKREKALEERNRAITEQKQREQRNLEMAKARLRQGELELERAMRVDRKGLQSQFPDNHP